MAQPVPIRLTTASGFACDTSLSKNLDTQYFVANSGSGAPNVSPVISASVSIAPVTIPAAVGPAQGEIPLQNPATGSGLYAVMFDAGIAGGAANISATAYYGIGLNGALPLRWIGGADVSLDGPGAYVGIQPDAGNGQNLVLYNTGATPITGNYYFFRLGGPLSGI